MAVGAFTAWFVRISERDIPLWRAVAAVVVLLGFAALAERVSPPVKRRDARAVFVLAEGLLFVSGMMGYAFLLHGLGRMAGTMIGMGIGYLLRAWRRPVTYGRDLPLWGIRSVDDPDDGRRWRSGAP